MLGLIAAIPGVITTPHTGVITTPYLQNQGIQLYNDLLNRIDCIEWGVYLDVVSSDLVVEEGLDERLG